MMDPDALHGQAVKPISEANVFSEEADEYE
jgi:hypothetical protein